MQTAGTDPRPSHVRRWLRSRCGHTGEAGAD
jgi:hypothetical protein